jgi:amino acid transporter
MAPRDAAAPETTNNHGLRRLLGTPDLISMQLILIVGPAWTGYAARQGSAQLVYWVAGLIAFFIPAAMTVSFCVKIWPLEGGVYQWVKHAIGPFAGFMSAWNFGAWAVLLIATIGTLTATSIHYIIGPSGAWIETSNAVITALNAVLLLFMLLVNRRGFGLGRWVAHFGTSVLIVTVVLAEILLFYHPLPVPEAAAQQKPFSLAFPIVTLLSANLFCKLTFQGLTGLEQVAVFAGETRNPARSILRSAYIAAPLIAIIYITVTGALLTYTPADQVDLNNPVPQLLGAGYGTGGNSFSLAKLVGQFTNIAFAIACVAQYAVIVAETSRLPMVAAWDHLIPPVFTRLHPHFRTPTVSLALIVGVAFAFSVLASLGAESGEAFQIMATGANIGYGVCYVLMFAVPLVAGTRLSPRPDLRPGVFLRSACIVAILVTLGAIVFALIPVVPVASPAVFAAKVAGPIILINVVGIVVYRRGARRFASEGRKNVLV